jgi:predicted ATPase/DNA-binding winged helix-turn-helix (wHTH) protein
VIFTSGECEIDLARRELRVRGVSTPIGGRAFEILEILAQSAGELVTKDQLMNHVWPGATVMEGTLHVHAVAIRKALGPLRTLLKTEPRRGYRLLGDWAVRRQVVPTTSLSPHRLPSPTGKASNLPAMITPLVGRSADIQRLKDLVAAYRVVCLTGPGGIGKTALALEVARRVLDRFDDGVWIAEFVSVVNPGLVPSAIAGTLGLRLESGAISSEAVAMAIGSKTLLLVLDNCEHVIAAVAALSEILVRLCPHITILATSRETLRVEGEFAYGVAALAVPAQDEIETGQILAHSAPELFVVRARELGSDFSSDSTALLTIASICRRVDGIPLAIELAAAHAATLGTEQVDTALRDQLAPLANRRRAALPRHQTLRATLDWSFNLLSELERQLLQRLAVFSGSFSLAAAAGVTNQAREATIADGIENLVAKSLVTSNAIGGAASFRLLETTRVYALSKLAESGELPEFSRRHAQYYRDLLEQAESELERRSIPIGHLDNIRAALEWSFGPTGDLVIGVQTAAVAAPVFLALSLFRECQFWSARAIRAIDYCPIGGNEEMQLQASLGVSLLQMFGPSDAAHNALARGLAIAEARGDALNQVRLMGMLSMLHVRNGDFIASLNDAKRSHAVEGVAGNPTALALANSILGRALQFVGEHDTSRLELEASLRHWSRSKQTGEVHLGLDHHILVGIGLARNLWFQGYPAQSRRRLEQTVADAERNNHPASLGLALSWAPGLFIWLGDLRKAQEHADWAGAHAQTHALGPYIAVASGYKGALAIYSGDARAGVQYLEDCLEQLEGMRYSMLSTGFRLIQVEGLIADGLPDGALALVGESIRRIETNGDLVHMPEALRVKAAALFRLPHPRADEAERCLIESLDWSRRQRARSWELRAASDLAALWASQQQPDRARAVLAPIFESFSEGFDTTDLMAAAGLMATLTSKTSKRSLSEKPGRADEAAAGSRSARLR